MVVNSPEIEELEESALVDALAPLPVEYNDLTEEIWDDLVKLKNPYLDNPAFTSLKKESSKHRQYFLYWSNLVDSERTDRNVADKFEITGAAVGRIRKSFNWEVRLDYFLKEDQKNIASVKGENFVDSIYTILGINKVVMSQFQQKVKLGEVSIGINDFIKLADMDIKLRRELTTLMGGGSADSVEAGEALTGFLNGLNPDLQSVLINNVNMTIRGQYNLPHDDLIKAEVGRDVQDIINLNEIGDDECFEYLEEDY